MARFPRSRAPFFQKGFWKPGLNFTFEPQGEIGPGNRAVTTDRRQFTLFYLFFFPFFGIETQLN